MRSIPLSLSPWNATRAFRLVVERPLRSPRQPLEGLDLDAACSARHVPATCPSTRNVDREGGVLVLKMRVEPLGDLRSAGVHQQGRVPRGRTGPARTCRDRARREAGPGALHRPRPRNGGLTYDPLPGEHGERQPGPARGCCRRRAEPAQVAADQQLDPLLLRSPRRGRDSPRPTRTGRPSAGPRSRKGDANGSSHIPTPFHRCCRRRAPSSAPRAGGDR